MEQHPTASTGSVAPEQGQAGAVQDRSGLSPLLRERLLTAPVRFPGDDGGRSLNEMAARDLAAALQLLAERAQYITGASGAAIALREGEEMICCASAGPSAPTVGTRAQVSSGLSGESVRTRQTLCCHDAATDPRVNPESCKAMGIASAMVMPLLRQGSVTGVFELLAGQPHAFEERDLLALERLGEMIQTAIDHAEAAKNAQTVIAAEQNSMAAAVAADSGVVVKTRQASIGPVAADPSLVERGKIGHCSTCGFPVPEGRTLCLDCSNSKAPQTRLADPVVRESPRGGASPLSLLPKQESWLQSHKYTIGTVLAVAITVTAVIFLR
jgi:putative methionine-R-sulfoxide reductase with GAF domain